MISAALEAAPRFGHSTGLVRDSPEGPATRPAGWRTWTLAALAGALIVGAGVALVVLVRDGADTAAVTIDEQAGAYRGVRFGSTEQGVIRVFGRPDRSPGFAPSGENPSQVGVPAPIPASPNRGGLLKYKGVGFLGTPESGVYAFIVTQRGATTTRGVAIGDSLDVARSRYRLRCSEVAGGESLLGGREFYPSCGARVGRGVQIWFGRDPIRSITLVSQPQS